MTFKIKKYFLIICVALILVGCNRDNPIITTNNEIISIFNDNIETIINDKNFDNKIKELQDKIDELNKLDLSGELKNKKNDLINYYNELIEMIKELRIYTIEKNEEKYNKLVKEYNQKIREVKDKIEMLIK